MCIIDEIACFWFSVLKILGCVYFTGICGSSFTVMFHSLHICKQMTTCNFLAVVCCNECINEMKQWVKKMGVCARQLSGFNLWQQNYNSRCGRYINFLDYADVYVLLVLYIPLQKSYALATSLPIGASAIWHISRFERNTITLYVFVRWLMCTIALFEAIIL